MEKSKRCTVHDCNLPNIAKGLCAKHYTRLKRHGSAAIVLVDRSGPKIALMDALTSATDDCIIWKFAKNAKGYGVISNPNGTKLASRYILIQATGKDETGMVAAHLPVVCHNRACINPRHLRWSSLSENSLDMRQDGTKPVGDMSPMSKLTEAQRIEISKDNRIGKVIAREYGITVSHVNRIKSGWKTANNR